MMTKEIQKRDYVREGVRYTIHVEGTEEGVMWGTWNCHDCGVGGSTGKSSTTVEKAVESAKGILERHHISNHQA